MTQYENSLEQRLGLALQKVRDWQRTAGQAILAAALLGTCFLVSAGFNYRWWQRLATSDTRITELRERMVEIAGDGNERGNKLQRELDKQLELREQAEDTRNAATKELGRLAERLAGAEDFIKQELNVTEKLQQQVHKLDIQALEVYLEGMAWWKQHRGVTYDDLTKHYLGSSSQPQSFVVPRTVQPKLVPVPKPDPISKPAAK